MTKNKEKLERKALDLTRNCDNTTFWKMLRFWCSEDVLTEMLEDSIINSGEETIKSFIENFSKVGKKH